MNLEHREVVASESTMDDMFDSIVSLDQTHIQEGYDEGHRDRFIAGREMTQQIGLKAGFEVREELGFYGGCVTTSVRLDPTRFAFRVKRNITQMEELIKRFPVMEPENETAQEIMDTLKLKFRAVCASIGVKLEYNGYPKSQAQANKFDF